jgi:integrase
MATIAKNPKNETYRILFYDRDKRRQAIYLGKVSEDTAEGMKRRVERFINAQLQGEEPSRADCEWLAKSQYKDSFRRVGLVGLSQEMKRAEIPTLEAFLKQYQQRRAGEVKPATRLVWSQVIGNLLEFMPKEIRLDEITTGHGKEFYSQLKAKGMKNSTIAKRLGFCRQFFNDAVDWEIITKNPFSKVHAPKSSLKSNSFVSRETIDRIMRLAPIRWKVIIALSRFGGLRTPSETLSIKWSNIDWEQDKMFIPEPKVEHQEGRGIRSCPLFPELRKVLADAFEIYGGGSEYVVDMPAYRIAAQGVNGWQNANLRTQFLKLIDKAGLEPWPRLFHSMRASRQTELEERFPSHVVCSWIGNSVAIAKASYLLITDAHYKQAATVEPTSQNGNSQAAEPGEPATIDTPEKDEKPCTKNDARTPENVLIPTPQAARSKHAKKRFPQGKTLGNPVFRQLVLNLVMEDNGLEPMTFCMPCKRSPN